jgi:serine/threonine protein kinase
MTNSNREAWFQVGDEPIPGFRLEKFLGSGQFGEVWQTPAPGGARPHALRFVELKSEVGMLDFRGVQLIKNIATHENLMPVLGVYLIDQNGELLDEEALDVLYQEVEATGLAATLQVRNFHPHFLVLDLPMGEKNLKDRLDECIAEGHSGIPLNELLKYMERIASAIDHLNSPKHLLPTGIGPIYHCDLKPQNIMLVGESLQVADFGLAQTMDRPSSGVAPGTPPYIAPECWETHKPSPTSDLYALAIIYYELRTGKLPFEAQHLKSISHVQRAHINGDIDTSLLENPEEIRILRRATHRDQSKRYITATEFFEELEALHKGGRSASGSQRWLMLAAAAMLFLVAGIFGYQQFFGNKAKPIEKVRVVTPPVQKPVNLEVAITPIEAKVEINGKAQDVKNGRLNIVAKTDDFPLRLTATAPGHEQYETYTSVAKLKINPVIQLKSWQDFLADAKQELSAGQFESSVNLYTNGLQLNPLSEAMAETSPLQTLNKFPTDTALAVRFGGPSDTLVAACKGKPNGLLRVFSATDGSEKEEMPQDWQYGVLAASSDGEFISGGEKSHLDESERNVQIWDGKKRQHSIPVAGDIWRVAISDSHAVALVLQESDFKLHAWNLNAETPEEILSGVNLGSAPVTCLTLLPDRILVGRRGSIEVWSLSNRSDEATNAGSRSAATFPFEGKTIKAIVASDGEEEVLVVSDSGRANSGQVEILDLKSGLVNLLYDAIGISNENSIARLQSGPLLVGDQDGKLHIIDLPGAKHREGQVIQAHDRDINRVTVDPSGQWFATGDFQGNAKLWLMKKNSAPIEFNLKYPFRNSADEVQDLAFSADGKWLAIAWKKGGVCTLDFQLFAMITAARKKAGWRDVEPDLSDDKAAFLQPKLRTFQAQLQKQDAVQRPTLKRQFTQKQRIM